MPTTAAVGIMGAAVVAEIVALPAVLLPGGTITLLAGALIGAGRPALAVALPVAAAVIGGDQLAAHSIATIGHVAGIVGIVASGLIVAGLVIARRRAARRDG